MFWGLRLEPGKRYSTTVDRSFHISMAALDCSSVKSDNEVLSVMLDEGETNVSFILCNLQKNKLMQSPLDLNFMTGDRITIYCKGSGVVHLSGYIAEEDDELEQLGEEDDDDEVEDEADELSENEEMQVTKGKGKLNGLQGKRKVDELKSPQPKRKKLEKMDEDTEDSDDEDDDMASDDVGDESMGLEGEESDEDDDDDDDDDEEEEEEDEDESDLESDEENKMPSKPQQQVKKNKKNKPQGQQQQVSNKQQNTPNLNKQQNQQNTPNLNKQQQNKGKQQQQQQQQKTPNGLSPETQMKKDKKKGDKTPGSTPNSNVKLNKTSDESSPNAKKGGEPHAKKTLDGGVMIKDLKVGNGPACKAGKMACVYYTGRFKQNNKVFDSTSEGPGFKFRVGKGDVIKGWDVGVIGMKVGGKRLITCPPHMAYGLKGSPPTIPANSTLIFEVELKSVN